MTFLLRFVDSLAAVAFDGVNMDIFLFVSWKYIGQIPNA